MLRELNGIKIIFIGTGLGIILFIFVGFLPVAVIGSYIGLKLTEIIFGSNSTGVLAELLSLLCMIGAVGVSAVSLIFGGTLLGYFVAKKLRKIG